MNERRITSRELSNAIKQGSRDVTALVLRYTAA
jgi:hypothetical protein